MSLATAPILVQVRPRWPPVRQDGPNKAPSEAKMAPRWPQDGPRWRSDGPRGAQEGPKMALRGPSMSSRRPKMAPIGFKSRRCYQRVRLISPSCIFLHTSHAKSPLLTPLLGPLGPLLDATWPKRPLSKAQHKPVCAREREARRMLRCEAWQTLSSNTIEYCSVGACVVAALIR